MSVFKINRRGLILSITGATVATGTGGLWLGIGYLDKLRYRKAVNRDGKVFAPSAYLAIDEQGKITVWVTRSEMGQGISTALPMLVAEELNANWDDVHIEQAVAEPGIDYGQLFTAASSSVTGEFHEFRRAGATARAMLLSAAADLLAVDKDECTVAASVIKHNGSGRSLTFADLASHAAKQWVPIRPDLKDPKDFDLIGHNVQRLDLPAKVTGKAIYGVDVSLPNMVRAVIARAPFFGAKLLTYDERSALAIPDVLSIHKISTGIAIVASTTFAALEGRRALRQTWSDPSADALSTSDVEQRLFAALDQPGQFVNDAQTAQTIPTINPPNGGEDRLVCRYQAPFLAHACMEPMNCTTSVNGKTCELWVPTQSPASARQLAADITGLPIDNITVNVTQLGGGFGRRAANDFVQESVELAVTLNRPVQVFWSREDDISHAKYRDASAHTNQCKSQPNY